MAEQGGTLWFQQENNLLRRVMNCSLIRRQVASIVFEPDLFLVAVFTGENLYEEFEGETVTVATKLGARGGPSDSVAKFFTTHFDGYDAIDPGGDTVHPHELMIPTVATRIIKVVYTNGESDSYALTEGEIYLLV